MNDILRVIIFLEPKCQKFIYMYDIGRQFKFAIAISAPIRMNSNSPENSPGDPFELTEGSPKEFLLDGCKEQIDNSEKDNRE